jgi:hypothetical protein
MGRQARLEPAQVWARQQAPALQRSETAWVLMTPHWLDLQVPQLAPMLVLMPAPSDDRTHHRTVHSAQEGFDRSDTASAVVSQRFRLGARFYPANFTDLASLTAALELAKK